MDAISQYLSTVQQQFKTSQATEHTYRSALESLVTAQGKKLVIINEPKRQACGAPDLIVTKGGTPLGYIETKDIGKSLGEIETDSQKKNPKTDNGRQLKRYREGLNNLIFTDYLEFRWYTGGTRRQTVVLATIDTKGKLHKQADGTEQLSEMFDLFLKEEIPTIGSPKELAASMATLARVIRDSIERAFKGEDKGGSLHAQWEGFKAVLLHSLTQVQFADMYAQTICYGLFAAKCNKLDSKITRRDVAHDLPKTNPFLRKMFGHMAGPDLHSGVVWAVEDLINLLNHADFHAILSDFGKRTKRQDPIVHFYETFLAAYDPKLRETRGVYYTPEPVVSYIVRSIDHILKTDFGIKDGLADRTKIPIYETVTDKNGKKKRKKTGECHKVLILDPAVGTGSFLHGVIDHIHEHIVEKGQSAGWSSYVYEHLLPRLFGFELLMAPYAIAHLKLGLQLAETGYKPPADKEEKRLGIYLTNSLEEAHDVQATLPFANFISDEANAASEIKSQLPVMVILGNPPYSSASENRGQWITDLMDEYKTTVRAEETQIAALSDDYVKFIRFAQDRIERTGSGVIGLITNNNYIDAINFRDMRHSLIKNFDRLNVLNLHGNARRRERTPDGTTDENVFDIRAGVAILLLAKTAGKAEQNAQHCADVFGIRSDKYTFLEEYDIGTTRWEKFSPAPPAYLLMPLEAQLRVEYEQLIPICECYGTGRPSKDKTRHYGTGFKTQQDEFAIAFQRSTLVERIELLLTESTTEDDIRRRFRMCGTYQWNFEKARRNLAGSNWRDKISQCLYRPFDVRLTVFVGDVVTNPRTQIMRHLLSPNYALCLGRAGQAIGGNEWNIVFCSSIIEDQNLFYRGGNFNFPLYLYPNGDLFDNGYTSEAPGGRRPNLSTEFVKDVAKKIKLKFVPDGVGDLKKTFGPEDIFHYMYAIFHSPTYRSRYAEFLKIDFPRLPLTARLPLFRSLCKLGGELVGLHLMEQQGPPLARFEQDGDMLVEQVRFTDEIAASSTEQRTPRNDEIMTAVSSSGKVWINDIQYFDCVPCKVWEFHIGGYQVCHKWLKDRKGRTLSIDDIEHYQHIVSALSETIRLMANIDAAIDKHGGWPIQ